MDLNLMGRRGPKKGAGGRPSLGKREVLYLRASPALLEEIRRRAKQNDLAVNTTAELLLKYAALHAPENLPLDPRKNT